MLRSIEQEKAKYAWKCIQEVKDKSEEVQKKYSSYVRKAPILIQVNGLPNTLAFYYNKRKKEESYKLLYEHITNWEFMKKIIDNKNPLNWVIENATFMEIIQVSQEIITLLNWMIKFAEAELKSEKGE